MRELAEFLAEASRRVQRIVVLCHHHADPDAVGSSVVLADVLKQVGARSLAGASEAISLASQRVLEAFGKEITLDPPLDADLVVLVDTSSLEHLGKLGARLRQRAPKLVVIDHHRPVEEMKNLASFHLVREDVTSVSELILKLIEDLGIGLKPEQASLLLAGIISDTGHLRLANDRTFESINSLIKAGADYRRVLEAIKPPEDISKRVAMLKAAQRLEIHKIQDHLVVFSELGSFEGDAASMLARIGADVAVVGSEEKGGFRLCGRARQELIAITQLHLGEVMEELAKAFGGWGGGHAGAASMNGKGKLADVKKHLLKSLQKALKPKE